MTDFITLLHNKPFALFSLILLLGLLGGEIVKRIPFLPKISGYILVGVLLGPSVLNIVDVVQLSHASIFINICLGLVMFEMGRSLHFSWFKYDKGLLLTVFFESLLTFISTFCILYFIGTPILASIIIAILLMATAPAVVLMVAHDLLAEGPVTRRTMLFTSVNNLICIVLYTLILPFASKVVTSESFTIFDSLYQIGGSIILGLIVFILARYLALLLGKRRETQFVLYIALVTLTISVAQILSLSTALAIYALGVAARNFDKKQALMEIDFGWFARMFFIILFVITGVYLDFAQLKVAFFTVFALLIARFASKYIALLCFAKMSHLSRKQTLTIAFALYPIAGSALGMSQIIGESNAELNAIIYPIVGTMVAILQILGPSATQFAFIKANETLALERNDKSV